MKILRTTHINLISNQMVNFPYNPQILGIKLEGDLVKVAYIEDQSQSGLSSLEFRMCKQNEEIDFDNTSYSYMGLIEHNDIDYHIFSKIVGQSQDFR